MTTRIIVENPTCFWCGRWDVDAGGVCLVTDAETTQDTPACEHFAAGGQVAEPEPRTVLDVMNENRERCAEVMGAAVRRALATETDR